METESAVIEQPIESTETAEVVETAEPVQTQTEVEETTGQGESTGDGRALPKDVQAALKTLREANPKVADALRKAWFAHEQFGQAYKTPAEAKAAKIALDTAGGAEGIATLREQAQASELLETAAEAGDPSVIDDWAKDYPEGFKKVMPHALRQFEKLDQQGFKAAIQPHVIAALHAVELDQRLAEAFDAIGADKKDDAKRILQNVYKWLEGQKAQTEKLSSQTTDPERAKFETERQKFNQERERAFQGDIGRETYRHQQDSVEKALASYLKGNKLTPEGKTELLRVINSGINETLKSDQAYQRQVKTFLAKRDSSGTTRFIKDHLDTLVPGIVQSKWRALYGAPVTSKPVVQKTENITAPQGAPIKIAKKPTMAEVSHDPGYFEAYIAGKGIMASGPYKGKLVTWR